MSPENHRPAFAPLACFTHEDGLLSAQAQRRWLLALMILGLALRLTRYLLRFPLWEDEAMLSANFLDRGYGQLLQPLNYCQVAPPLFLWGQLALTRLLGFNEYALRLLPFLCGLGSLFLFRHVAGRLLQGVSLVLAVGLFAIAYPMTRYAAEAKPYGCDLLVALAFFALAIEWLRRPDQTRWLWCLAAIVGPAIGYSFPTIFIGGGVSLVVAWALWSGRTHHAPRDEEQRTHHAPRDEDRHAERDEYSGWRPWIVYNAIFLAGVAATLALSKHSVNAATQQNMEDGWTCAFPPILEPLKLPRWLLETHAGGMLGYPVGGPHYGSSFSLLCLTIGVASLALRRRWLLMGLLLAPLGLNFLAAALHRFPYGGHARMTLFLAPAFCTLIAYGLTAALAWIEGRVAAILLRQRHGQVVIAMRIAGDTGHAIKQRLASRFFAARTEQVLVPQMQAIGAESARGSGGSDNMSIHEASHQNSMTDSFVVQASRLPEHAGETPAPQATNSTKPEISQGQALRTGEETSVADHGYMVPGSAKVAYFRGAKGDNATLIDSPVLSTRSTPGFRRVVNGATIALAVFVLIGAGSWLRDVTQPYKSGTTLRARDFAQWFWFAMPHDCELVSCEADMQTDLSPGKVNHGWSAIYRCNQRIYWPRLAHGERPDFAKVSVDRPLRCVLYRSPDEEKDSPSPDPQAREHWLEKMQAKYDLVGHDTYPVAPYDKKDREQISEDYVELFKFVPKN